MKCPELVLDKRSNKTRICGKEINGFTGLQEAQNFQKHLRSRHSQPVDLLQAVERRAASGQ